MTVKIYLCGGLVTDWQDKTIEAFEDIPDVEFYNPKMFDIIGYYPEVHLYGPMDRYKVEDCDIIFGFLEASNPTCVNVVGEMMLAKGLGKRTILVNEWTEENFKKGYLKTLKTKGGTDDATWFKPHYLDLFLSWCDIVETDFGIGIEVLKKMVEYEPR
jgi:hypothetical protein